MNLLRTGPEAARASIMLAHGAGAEVRKAMGATVFAGMIGVTVFGLFLTPVFYVLLQRQRARQAQPATALPALENTHV